MIVVLVVLNNKKERNFAIIPFMSDEEVRNEYISVKVFSEERNTEMVHILFGVRPTCLLKMKYYLESK